MTKVAVLEAVIVASVMLSAIAYVTTYEQPLPEDLAIQSMLETKSRDFLLTAQSLPATTGTCGGTLLEQLLREGIEGNNTAWDRRTDAYFGPAVDKNLYFSNGHATMPIFEKYDFRGQGHATSVYPDFTYAMALAPIPVSDTITIETLALARGTLLRPKGEVVRMTLEYDTGPVHNHETALGIIGMSAEKEDEAGGVTSIRWASSVGAPMMTKSLAGEDGTGSRLVDFFLQMLPLTNTSPDETSWTPANTALSVQLPPMWTFTPPVHSDWSFEGTTGRLETGSILHLRLRHPVQTEHVIRFPLRAPVLAPGELPPRLFETLEAQLGNGSLGRATLLVKFENALEKDLPRALHLTTPYPVRNGTDARFGFAFANGGPRVTLRALDVEIPGGYDLQRHGGAGAALFAPFADDAPGEGWRFLDAKHVRWEGEVEVLEHQTWGAFVLLPITDDGAQATSLEGPTSAGVTSTLSFANGFEDASTRWGSAPGVLRHEVEPSSGEAADGYPADLLVDHAFTATSFAFRSMVTHASSYRVSPSAESTKTRNAAANGSFELSRRMVPVGSFVRADVDFESLASELAAQGATDTRMVLDLYAPPSLGCAPTRSWSRTPSQLPAAGVTALLLHDPLEVGAPVLFVGAVDAQVHRVEPGGVPSWSAPVAFEPRFLAARGDALFVGTANGTVHRLDAVTGALEWSTHLVPDLAVESVTGLAVDPSGTMVAAATSAGRLVLLHGASGVLVAESSDASVPGRGFSDLAWSDGGLLARRPDDGLVALDGASLAVLAARPGSFARLVEGPASHAYAADGDELVFLDRATLGTLASVPFDEPIVLLERGHVDADGVLDAIVALRDSRVRWVSGATRVAHDVEVPGIAHDGAKLPEVMGPDLSALDLDDGDRRVVDYQDVVAATLADLDNRPLALAAHEGTLALAHQSAGAFRSTVWPPAAAASSAWLQDMPTTLIAGRFGVERAVLLGTASGEVVQYDASTGALVRSTRVADFVGRWSQLIPVPAGGFFGTHVVVARVEWGGATPGSTSFVDWFEVVGEDGAPVANPGYKVELVVRDLADEE